ncbi:MAG: pyruvate dehydrogenase (acetyl-transferring), homodimeric type [Planctomycetes bacterium]|nr:pyruvate dehydrogenase (acetyl-transferring), homodimeric type [Planctomycetota bacterium]
MEDTLQLERRAQELGIPTDGDPQETAEWVEAFDQLVQATGTERARFILRLLLERAEHLHVRLPEVVQTPYVNTIPAAETPAYPGDEDLERNIRRIIRWNAAAMVMRANARLEGIGGHLATYASIATLYEVGFNHFFRGRSDGLDGDQIYFQGHSSPGIYARAFLEGRVTLEQMEHFRQETSGQGLPSYPHPWLMKNFWEFPTVSMGLGPLSAIMQARFNRYLRDRNIKNTDESRVWCFVGDGECDEPETLGALSLAARERLDNLVFVVNCNLQRLDGPVRGNGKIIQELETVFRGAGWNVIKVIWGRDWDPLLEADHDGLLRRRMMEAVDGDYQKYSVEPGSYTRQHFFGKVPSLLRLVESLTDDQIRRMRRGGHDCHKVYAAYKAACEPQGRPTAVLAKTVKGWALGEGAEGRNAAHQAKKFNLDQLKKFRDILELPIPDKELEEMPPFYVPPKNSDEIRYLLDRRRLLGGFVPARRATFVPIEHVPPVTNFSELLAGSKVEASTTKAFTRMLGLLLKDPDIGRRVVPIIPDEARTFGMDTLFKQVGIYSSVGQLYEPVDSAMLISYREAKDGQVIEEGINEAGAMGTFTAAGTSYATHGFNMIPFYIFYSMFGYQRVGDLMWAAGDMRARGFLIGATAGRTTLNGEGLQHEDGHSALTTTVIPDLRAYDPAYAYELAVIIHDGMRRMLREHEDLLYYITVYNENYEMPPMPEGVENGILRGCYLVRTASPEAQGPKAQLLGSGTLLREALRAQEILRKGWNVAADVWSVTSYPELRRDAMAADRWNMLHPEKPPRAPYVASTIGRAEGPIVAVSDYLRLLPDMIARWLPDRFFALGTDGFGRSDTRAALRRHFEIDAESIAVATLWQISKRGLVPASEVTRAIREFGISEDRLEPWLF